MKARALINDEYVDVEINADEKIEINENDITQEEK